LDGPPAAKEVVLVIYAYGDDGADEKRERVIAVAVIAGREEWWQNVEDQWVIRSGGIPFHATDCESNHGDYENIPHDENKAMYRDLTGILAASNLGGIGIATDLIAAKQLMPGNLALAYYRSFVECLEKIANVAQNLGEIAKVTFDINTENEYNAALLYSWARGKEGRLHQWLNAEISFVPWRESARVQTADLLAFEAWKALDHTVGSIKRTRKSWELLRATGRFETYSYSEQWFRDLRAHIDSGDLEKIVGFNESHYLEWLRKTGRKHSTSNLFHFLNSMDKR